MGVALKIYAHCYMTTRTSDSRKIFSRRMQLHCRVRGSDRTAVWSRLVYTLHILYTKCIQRI